MKRSIFFVILTFILLSCGEKIPEIKTFTFYNGDVSLAHVDIFETPIGREITKLTGVRLEVSWPGAYSEDEMAEIMTAAGDYPDIIYGHNATGIFLTSGALIPLNDLIDQYGPNIKKHYGNNLNQFKNDEGIIYYIGRNYVNADLYYPDSAFWLPVDLLEKAGWPDVKTFEEYFQLIRDYVKEYPEIDGQSTIGFTAITDSWRIFTLFLAPAQLMGYPNDGNVYVDSETFEARLILQSDFAKSYFRMLNRLWNEKMMDLEMFTQSYSQYVDKIISGRVVGFYDHTWQILEAISMLKNEGRENRLPVPFPVLFEGVGEDRYNFVKAYTTGNGVGISVDCLEPAEVVKFWNRMLEEDIQILNFWGIEKKDYTIENGVMVKSKFQLKLIGDQRRGLKQFIYGFPQIDQSGFFSDGNPVEPASLPELLPLRYTSVQNKVLEQYGLKSFRDKFTPSRVSPYGFGWSAVLPAEGSVPEAAAKIDELMTLYFSRLISVDTDKFDETWSEFLNKLENIDVRAYLDYLSAVFKKRAAGDWY